MAGLSIPDSPEGCWVLCSDTHEWWRLPEHKGGYTIRKTLRTAVIPPDPIPGRRRRLVQNEAVQRAAEYGERGKQMVYVFPGEIVAIVKDALNREVELIWWDV
jgi:hypothetical protein